MMLRFAQDIVILAETDNELKEVWNVMVCVIGNKV